MNKAHRRVFTQVYVCLKSLVLQMFHVMNVKHFEGKVLTN